MKLLILLLSLNSLEPRVQVVKFYDWYLNMIQTGEIYKMVTPASNKGQTYLKYQPYLDSLKKLNTFHNDFFNLELQTFQHCNSFLQQWTWENYQQEEPRYDGYCDFLNYQRWFWTQEPVTNIEIVDQSISGELATIKLRALYIEGAYTIVMNPGIIIIELKKEYGNWLITSITNK